MYVGSADAVIIRRVDVLKVHDYARQNCDLRDYLMIRLPLKIGLRTGEICSLRVEDVNWADRSFTVIDSKRKRPYPLPLDPVTVQLLKDLVGVRLDGYVFTQKRSWTHLKEGEPLTLSTVWVRVRTIAASAGVRGFNPRRFRQYFAAEWSLQKRSLELLRRILRHKSLAYTQFYLSKLIFWEDLQSEYERFQDGPFVGGVVPEPRQVGVAEPLLNGICSVCGSLSVCKYADRMPSWATGCRFHVPTIGKSEERSCLKQKS